MKDEDIKLINSIHNQVLSLPIDHVLRIRYLNLHRGCANTSEEDIANYRFDISRHPISFPKH